MNATTSHAELIGGSIQALYARKADHWARQHAAAWSDPGKEEAPIVRTIEAMALYADNYRERFEDGIGNDGVLGDCWADILRNVHRLLDGETGRLDCGTASSLIVAMLKAEGFSDDA